MGYETFGTKRTAIAPLYHLKKEVDETIEAMKEGSLFPIREELADCFILILNASSKYGLVFKTLLSDAKEKLIKNKARKWGKPDENGVVEHIRTNSVKVPSEMEVESWCDQHHLSIDNRMIALKTARWIRDINKLNSKQ